MTIGIGIGLSAGQRVSGGTWAPATFYRAYAYSGTAWSAADSDTCTLLWQGSIPILPPVAVWYPMAVGSTTGTGGKLYFQFLSSGKLRVRARSGATNLTDWESTAAILPTGTEFQLQVTVDMTQAQADRVKVWLDGSPVAGTNSSASTGSIPWSSTNDSDGSRKAVVGGIFAITPTLNAPVSIGYVDGGSGDVPWTIRCAAFSSQVAYATPFTTTEDMTPYAGDFELLMGRTPGYKLAAWQAGSNDGTGADLTVAEIT